jgi:hypothetical protein
MLCLALSIGREARIVKSGGFQTETLPLTGGIKASAPGQPPVGDQLAKDCVGMYPLPILDAGADPWERRAPVSPLLDAAIRACREELTGAVARRVCLLAKK